MLYGLMQSDGKIIRKEAELYKLLITATDKDGKRFNKKTSATVKVGDTVYRERYVSAIFECTCDTSDGQSARTHLGHTYKKTGMIRAPFKVVAYLAKLCHARFYVGIYSPRFRYLHFLTQICRT